MSHYDDERMVAIEKREANRQHRLHEQQIKEFIGNKPEWANVLLINRMDQFLYAWAEEYYDGAKFKMSVTDRTHLVGLIAYCWDIVPHREDPIPEQPVEDVVNKPKHYQFFDMEAIEVIRNSLTEEEFRGYCKGNGLKYRLRAGKKDATEQEIAKAEKYESLYEEYKDGVK